MTVAPFLLLLAAPGAIDAERAFAAMAQTEGQWTAFRAWAAPDALFWAPEPVNAQQWLAGRKDPPVPVMWWPGRAWVSCDGALAVTTGPWIRSGGKATGTFTTVWQRRPDGAWKWQLDHGRNTPRAVPAGDDPVVERPVCRNLAEAGARPPSTRAGSDVLVQLDGRMPGNEMPDLAAAEGAVLGSGASPDGSLRWEARALAGGEGAHTLRVWTWRGRRHELALFEATGLSAGE